MMDEFKTIRDDTSDVLFSLRQFNPPVSPLSNTSQSPCDGSEIIQQVLHSARLKNALSGIAEKQGIPVEDVFKEARGILEDIGHTFSLKSIRCVAYFIRKVFRNIYSGIKVNVAGMKKVKELSKEFPVILVPSHRSYTDFLLVSFVCFIYHLPLPVIAAAQDFKNMTMIGGILQSCGAFYMKRSFRSDELYWTVFFEYVQCLVLNSGTTMEFFLEGTRSRSGKSLHPKQGLLSILTDLYFTSRVPDIMFCPVGISYDRVLEESLLARELLGIPKPKESLRGLLKSRSVLSDDYGFAYLYFGEPISLREFVQGYETRLTKTTIPKCVRNDPNHEELVIVRKLGNHIMKRIQDHLIILPNMVVASLLLQNPTGIKLGILIQQYTNLTIFFRKCDIHVLENENDDSQSAVMESLQLLKSSVILTKDNLVCLLDPEDFSQDFKDYIFILLTKNNPNCQHINDGNKDTAFKTLNKMSDLSSVDQDYLLDLTCLHLQLAHQRNQLLHWFYLPAMVILSRCDKNSISQEKLYNDSKMLGDILCLEIGREEFISREDFFAQLNKFKALGISVQASGQCETGQNDILFFIENLWHPLLTSYWVVYRYILESCNEGTEYIPDELVHHCQDFAASLFLKGVVSYLEIQSLEALKNGLKSLQKLHILQQLKHHADKTVVLVNKTALYNLVVAVESNLGLAYSHPPALSSKL